MSITVRRKASGGGIAWDANHRVKELDIDFLVGGAKNKDEAAAAIRQSTDFPAKVDNLLFSSLRFSGYTGDGFMEFTAAYEKPESNGDPNGLPLGYVWMGFDGSTESALIQMSKQQVIVKLDDDNPPDPLGLIGCDPEYPLRSTVEGCDILTPFMRVSYYKVHLSSEIDQSFAMRTFDLTATVNQGAFKGFAARSALFLGASGSGTQDPNEHVVITYNFAVKRPEAIFYKGRNYGSKGGWDHIWTAPPSRIIAGNKIIFKRKAYYVDRVYSESNFGIFGL